VAGKYRGALDLRGKSWLECPQPEVSTDRPMAMTVAAWVKLRSFSDSHTALATRQIGTGYEDQFFLGFLGEKLRAGSQAWQTFLVQPAPLALDRWFHLAFTHEEDGMTRLYLDGVEVARRRGPHLDRGRVISSLTLGAGQYARNPHLVRQRLDGVLDEVRIYARALPPAQIAALAAGAGASR
jgi:hypothetical protein